MTQTAANTNPSSLFAVDERDYFTELLDELGVGANLPAWPDQFGLALNDWASRSILNPPITLSLFSGAGGLDIGFHDAGFKIVEMVELEEKFAETLSVNTSGDEYLGNGHVHCIDIRDFQPTFNGQVDFIIGGPPCQSFSAAGRRASGVTGINDSRGTLFEEYVRLLKHYKPKGFLFENVYGITGANQGKAWAAIQEGFANAGYTISSRVLDTADFGVPQHRERMFIVGSRQKRAFAFPRPTHGPDSNPERDYYSAGLAVQDAPGNVPEVGIKGKYGSLLKEIPPGLNYSFFTEKLGHPNPLFAWRSKFSDFLYKADPELPVRTIKAQGGQYTGPFHWTTRPFSLEELKRLQTFPDTYKISGGRQAVVHQIGNSVPPQVARCLALAILDQFFDVQLPIKLDYLDPSEKLGFRTRKRQRTKVYQQKAKQALVSNGNKSTDALILPKRRTLIRHLNLKTFSWSPTKECHSDIDSFKCSFRPNNNEWVVDVIQNDVLEKFSVKLEVGPSSSTSSWTLPVQSIRIEASGSSSLALTAAWKFLEEQLASNNIRADIVQFIGYFQYKPAIECKWVKPPSKRSRIGALLNYVSEGYGVRRTLPMEYLAKEWNVSIESVGPACEALRRLGYEVRNQNTNAEIPSDHFLVPYPFPTLNPKSVQLRKELVSQGAESAWKL